MLLVLRLAVHSVHVKARIKFNHKWMTSSIIALRELTTWPQVVGKLLVSIIITIMLYCLLSAITSMVDFAIQLIC